MLSWKFKYLIVNVFSICVVARRAQILLLDCIIYILNTQQQTTQHLINWEQQKKIDDFFFVKLSFHSDTVSSFYKTTMLKTSIASLRTNSQVHGLILEKFFGISSCSFSKIRSFRRLSVMKEAHKIIITDDIANNRWESVTIVFC